MDVVAFHLVTMGRRASEYAQELFKADNYANYLYFHGLGVESAEALAEQSKQVTNTDTITKLESWSGGVLGRMNIGLVLFH